MKKTAIIITIVLVAVLSAFFFLRGKTITINKNTTIEGNYSVPRGATLSLENNAVLSILGNLDVEGNIKSSEDLNLAVSGNITLSKNSKLVSAGNIQITADTAKILKTDEEIEKAIEETEEISENTNSLGPFNDNNAGDIESILSGSPTSATNKKARFVFVNIAHAQEASSANEKTDSEAVFELSGKWSLKDNAEEWSGRKIVYINTNPRKVKIVMKDLKISVWPAKDGRNDEFKKCKARGDDGEDGGMMRIAAWQVVVEKNVVLNLGDGGNGGNAKTKKQGCNPAEAFGGSGGEAGNLKITSEEGIFVNGPFIINPGKGGDGGDAIAVGGDGVRFDPFTNTGGHGGKAEAGGGSGADNYAIFYMKGDVNMTFNGRYPNLTIGNIVAGNGGYAAAIGGRGENADKCGEPGREGGSAEAYAGDGGYAAAFNRIGDDKKDKDYGIYKGVYAGDGGFVSEASGGKGGDGADGSLCPAGIGNGGNGGAGGDAKGVRGEGGVAVGLDSQTMRAGTPSKVSAIGGDGGDGGDSCQLGGFRGSGGRGDTANGRAGLFGLSGARGDDIPWDCGGGKEPKDKVDDNENVVGNPPDDFSKTDSDAQTTTPDCGIPSKQHLNNAIPSNFKYTILDNKRVRVENALPYCGVGSLQEFQDFAEKAARFFSCRPTVSDFAYTNIRSSCSFIYTFGD